jgi:hypothetical protein
VLVANAPEPTHAVAISETDIDRAVASLAAHAAYLEGLGDTAMADPAGFLRPMFESAAPRFGGQPAMTFELLPM